MLITDKRFPILEKLTNGDLGVLGFDPEDVEYANNTPIDIMAKFTSLCSAFKQPIRLVSTSFFNSYQMAKDKLNTPELFQTVDSQSGTLLIGLESICYRIDNKQNYILIDFIALDKDRLNAVGFGIEYKPNYGFIHSDHYWFTKAYLEADVNITLFCENLLLWLNFFKYVQLETKLLGPKTKGKVVDSKYVNQTKSAIEYVNSTWFTNLVKSDGFKVRGHFRMQVCGTGRQDRKLTWINDFEKTGYTAPARKLTEYAE
jgi:hypothetical protein